MNTESDVDRQSTRAQPQGSGRWVFAGCIFLGVVLCGLAIVLGWIATISLEGLRDYGRLVRNPQDVTPERYSRFQHVCWFAAASLASLGAGFLVGWQTLYQFVRRALRPEIDRAAISASDGSAFPRWQGWFAFILCIGAALRLSLIAIPMAYDEAYSWVNFASRPLPQALGDLNSTNNHLFNTVCMSVTGRLFGPQEWALRIGVMCFGLALLPASFVWARRWLGTSTALLTTALLAISAPLISYSADARGYSFVLCAAVLLDDALARVVSQKTGRERSWILAGVAMVVGIWSMIIMGYAIVASLMWYLLTEASPAMLSGQSRARSADAAEIQSATLGTKLRQLTVLGWLTLMAASLIYLPGYICRGTLFLNDPVMRQSSNDSTSFLWETWQGLVHAGSSGLEGAIPAWVIVGSVLVGLWFWPRNRHSVLRLMSPFVVVLALNFVRHVNPPPRVYLWLMPWVCLAAAHGAISLARLLRVEQKVTTALIVVTLSVGVWYGAAFWPILLRSEDRIGYVSVPEAVRRLQQEVVTAPTAQHRLIAPLPCDLPSIFYMERAGFRVPLNGLPQPGEHIWLMAPETETPVEVLEDGLVQLNGWQDRFTDWQVVERFETLTLYSAVVLPVPLPSPE